MVTPAVSSFTPKAVVFASEGSLAVLSELTLKLIPLPKFKKTAFAIFPSVKSAMNAVYKSLASGVSPVSMEFLDNLSIRAVESKFNKGLPIEAGAILIADVDGNVKEAIDEDLRNLEYYFLEAGASRGIFLKNEKTREEFFSLINSAKQVRF